MARPKKVVEPVAEVTETVEAVETIEPVAVEAPSYPTVKNYNPMIEAICTHYGAAVLHRDGTAIVFQRGELAGAINLANYETTEKAIEALRTTSLAR